MFRLTRPVECATGPAGTKAIFNNHATVLNEIIEQVEELDQRQHNPEGEPHDFMGTEDAEIVIWRVRAMKVESDVE